MDLETSLSFQKHFLASRQVYSQSLMQKMGFGVSENGSSGVPSMYVTVGPCFRNVIVIRGTVQWLLLGIVTNSPLPVSVGFNKPLFQSAGLSMFTNNPLLLFEMVQKLREISMNVSRLRSFVRTQRFSGHSGTGKYILLMFRSRSS